MASELLVATRSADKLREIQAVIAATTTVRLVTLRDLDVPSSPAEDDVEQFDTFIDNAIAKARYFANLTGMPVLADDSGLSVAALDGGPGVRTKRFAIDHHAVDASTSGTDLDAANNRLLLEKLNGNTERSAHYIAAIALLRDGKLITSVGTVSGTIATEPKGTGGFGYDPLFEIPNRQRTFAELTPKEKNRLSHRAVALRALASSI